MEKGVGVISIWIIGTGRIRGGELWLVIGQDWWRYLPITRKTQLTDYSFYKVRILFASANDNFTLNSLFLHRTGVQYTAIRHSSGVVVLGCCYFTSKCSEILVVLWPFCLSSWASCESSSLSWSSEGLLSGLWWVHRRIKSYTASGMHGLLASWIMPGCVSICNMHSWRSIQSRAHCTLIPVLSRICWRRERARHKLI